MSGLWVAEEPLQRPGLWDQKKELSKDLQIDIFGEGFTSIDVFFMQISNVIMSLVLQIYGCFIQERNSDLVHILSFYLIIKLQLSSGITTAGAQVEVCFRVLVHRDQNEGAPK